jgi:hypothetical protein
VGAEGVDGTSARGLRSLICDDDPQRVYAVIVRWR